MKINRRELLNMIPSTIAAIVSPMLLFCTTRKRAPEKTKLSSEQRIAKAHALLGKYNNCCTAVLAAYAAELGMDQDIAVSATQGMPGIGLTGNTCGTVSGAALVIGLKAAATQKSEKVKVFSASKTVKEFVARFEQRHSSVLCSELLGWDISTPQKLAAASKENAFSKCPQYIESAVGILESIFEEHNV